MLDAAAAVEFAFFHCARSLPAPSPVKSNPAAAAALVASNEYQIRGPVAPKRNLADADEDEGEDAMYVVKHGHGRETTDGVRRHCGEAPPIDSYCLPVVFANMVFCR